MEQRIKQLLKRLAFLGYCSFAIKSIVQEAIGRDDVDEINQYQSIEVIRHLEFYEQLGANFVEVYSK
ncbi:hypothetical protein HA075_11940 [bacterium BFN5]|nr:hypothetical protein HA075_11930 [bacterium BFN5]QJW46476.1 hypothetical protein HA075_11940 [bacterium BFN5]